MAKSPLKRETKFMLKCFNSNFHFFHPVVISLNIAKGIVKFLCLLCFICSHSLLVLLQHTEAKLGHLRYHNKTIERLFYNQPKYRLENILAMITSWRTCSICETCEASVSMADLNGELSWERREKYLTQSVSNLIPAIPDPLFLVCSPFPNANKQFHTQIGQNVSETMFSNVSST